QGLPFVFQHGLGGDLSQPFAVYRAAPGIRLLGFDARGHGQTHPLGDVNKLSIAALTDDLIAFLDYLGIDRAMVGGISLGSGLAGDTPCRDRADYRTIPVPTLILGNRQDPIHPWAVAETLSQLIPGAEFREITPKSVSLEAHAADVQKAVDAFLMQHGCDRVL